MKRFEGKRLLILGATITECDIVRYAKAMGIYTIVADYNEDSPAKKIADKAVLVDALNVEALVKCCKEEKVDGVITGFVDILLRPYMEVCRRLCLPCYVTEKMLSMSTNKREFKSTCDKFDIPVPKTYFVGKKIDEKILNDLLYPVFVKPLDGSGSRGAGVARNEKELREQFDEATRYSSTEKAIIEDYLHGREFLLDYVAVDGNFRLLSIFDRYIATDRGSAINYSTIAISPSRAVDYYLKSINDRVVKMFKKLGFSDGLLFMQGYYDGNRVTFFEMGCRLGGSYFAHEQECLGDNAIDMVVRYALTGKMVDDINAIKPDAAKYNKYAVDYNFLLKGRDETVAAIKGLEEVRRLPGCIEILKYHDVGYHYVKDKTVDKPIFTIELVANTKEELIDKIDFINSSIDVLNERSESLLMEKLNPRVLFE